MADDLRAALVEAKLAGTKAEDGAHAYLFRSNETAALVALDVFARWLRAEARELRRLAADAKDRRDDGDPDGERQLQRFLAQAVALEGRALDALTQPSTEETRDA